MAMLPCFGGADSCVDPLAPKDPSRAGHPQGAQGPPPCWISCGRKSLLSEALWTSQRVIYLGYRNGPQDAQSTSSSSQLRNSRSFSAAGSPCE